MRSRLLVWWSTVGVMLVVLAAGCTATDDADRSTDTRRSPPGTPTAGTGSAGSAAPGTTAVRRSTVALVCNGADEVNEDDDGAVQSLLKPAQLPAGEWRAAEAPPCPWALSADELLTVAECRTAATNAGAAPNEDARNGNGRTTYARGDQVQLDDRVEIYTSRQNVDAIRAILASPAKEACYAAALRQRATDDPDTVVNDIRFDEVAVPDAAALGLGFPASPGYAADAGFVAASDITFTVAKDGTTTPVVTRVVTFGSGGALSTVTLIGASASDLDAIDLDATLRGAAQNYTAMFGA